jgi:adenosylcobinamide kinase/adenosylcobinamide-phosphate guanylyltransferase
MTAGDLTFVLGGARSGKSRHAEAAIRGKGPGPWLYVATGQAFDDEMTARIARHRADRGEGWITVEAPHDLAATLRAAGSERLPILVDCLTLWLSNRLLAAADVEAESRDLVDALAGLRVPAVVVSNEVGLGIVPDNALSRAFRDAAGRLHQAVAARADHVVLVVAGLPLVVK